MKYDNIVYILNEKENTASIMKCINDNKCIIIPSSINHKSKEYIVNCILEEAIKNSKNEILQFSSDSHVQSIEQSVFFFSSITKIIFPPSLIDLKEGWFNGANKLREIVISPNNPRYKIYENKFIIGKSTQNIDNYDTLVYSFNINENIIIPDFIEYISSNVFQNFRKLKHVEIGSNSNLKIIGEDAFSQTGIESITIPSQLKRIGKHAFYYCRNLRRIEISNKSKLEKIDEGAFSNSLIESISIPSHFKRIRKIEM